MKTVVWLTEGAWEACVDAARELTAETDELTLLHVLDPEIGEAMRAAHLGLLGRTGSGPDPAAAVEEAAAAAQDALLTAAEQRLGRPAAREARRGRAEQEVVGASAGAGMLIMARDGDHARLGPRSLGPASRFVLDHAPCRVLLVWPDEPPDIATLPGRPARPHGPPPAPPHGRPQPPPPRGPQPAPSGSEPRPGAAP
jgi:nucleotide-binding universal stress UspA family protein